MVVGVYQMDFTVSQGDYGWRTTSNVSGIELWMSVNV
jgi:hypothetical protein